MFSSQLNPSETRGRSLRGSPRPLSEPSSPHVLTQAPRGLRSSLEENPTRHGNRSRGACGCRAPDPAGIRQPWAARPVCPGGSHAHTRPGHQHQSIRAPARRSEPLQNPPRLRLRGRKVWSWIPQGGQDLGRAGMEAWLNQTDGFPVPPGEAAGPPCSSIRRPRQQRERP